MQKFPKIRYPSDEQTDGLLDGEVVVTEKLDGANFRFTFTDDGVIKAGSRNVVFTNDGEPLPLDEINRSFRHAIEYLRETVDVVTGDMSQYTFYGEAMHLHSLEYEDIDYETPHKGSPYPSNQPNVVLFDAQQNGEWMQWDDFYDVATRMGMTVTNVIERGDPTDLSLDVPSESMFGGPPEGIVVRRTDGTVRAKKVTDDFKETNAVSFNDPGKAETDAGQFVAKYVTDNRIEKTAHKLVDEGGYESLKMEMMQDLPMAVIQDVFAEHGWDLLTNDFECTFDEDFKSAVRSKTSTACSRQLRQMMQEF